MTTFFAFPCSITEAVTLALATSAPTFSPSLLTASTLSNVTVSPASAPSFSTLMISPSATLYCLPPVAIIAYIWHLLLSLLARYGGPSSGTLQPLCAAYSMIIPCQPVSVKFFRQRITFFLAGNFFGTGDGQRAGTDMTGYA